MTTTKAAGELVPGDLFRPLHGTLWRRVLAAPVTHPPFLVVPCQFQRTDGRMAGSGDKNEFHPSPTFITYLGPHEHVIVTTEHDPRAHP